MVVYWLKIWKQKKENNIKFNDFLIGKYIN